MRSLKSGLIAIALTGLFGTVAVIGCSASGGDTSGLGVDTPATDPTGSTSGGGASLPPRPDTPADEGDSSLPDAGHKDASKAETGVDAGPPPPVEGAACTTLNAIATKPCGACGTASTVCLASGSGDGGAGTWSTYGACTGELAGGCTPGTVTTESCGNCGTQTKTCTKYCAYSTSACTGQPANSCAPGAEDYTNAGCPAQSYHERTCGSTCVWSNYSMTCDAPNNANKLTISGTLNGTVVGNYTLSAAKVGPRVTGSCPGGSVSATADYPYEIVEVKNATAMTAKVSAWNSGAASIDDVMVAYNTNLPPTTSTQLAACTWGVNDFCPSSLPCTTDDNWAGLTGTQQIVIPPGQVVLIRFSAYYGLSTAGETNTGAATLTVRTDALN